jgi:phospholipid transport system substrate-binding protein
MPPRRLLYAWLLATITFLVHATAYAAESAEQFVRSQQADLAALLGKPKSHSREQKITELMDQVFDYGELAKRSLGDEWQSRTDAEKTEFQKLLEQLVRQSYRRNLDKILGWDVTFSTSHDANGLIRVPTVAKHKTDARKDPVSIDYLLSQATGKWRVCDIVVEGSSLVGNYNSQFRKIIRKQGFTELLARMKRRVQKGGE